MNKIATDQDTSEEEVYSVNKSGGHSRHGTPNHRKSGRSKSGAKSSGESSRCNDNSIKLASILVMNDVVLMFLFMNNG